MSLRKFIFITTFLAVSLQFSMLHACEVGVHKKEAGCHDSKGTAHQAAHDVELSSLSDHQSDSCPICEADLCAQELRFDVSNFSNDRKKQDKHVFSLAIYKLVEFRYQLIQLPQKVPLGLQPPQYRNWQAYYSVFTI